MRKTYKDYRKEYDDLERKLEALESSIINRAEVMVVKQPAVPIKYLRKKYTVKSFLQYLKSLEENEIYLGGPLIEEYLFIINTIEQYNEKKSNIRQLNIFDQRQGIHQ